MMIDFKLLLVEDDGQARRDCLISVSEFENENECKIEVVESTSVEEAINKLDNTFDAAIIDLKLNSAGNEGNEVLKQITERHYRIPTAILTGTPDVVDPDFTHIGVFRKGEPGTSYSDLLLRFWEIHKTGLTRIMGGRGIIETTLSKVFMENILPQKDKWIAYGGKDSTRTERALLRHTLNHLHQLLDDDRDRSFPEEMYLHPPLTENLRTGSIIKSAEGDKYHIVVSPACDLAIRDDGNINTDRILLAEIEESSRIIEIALRKCSTSGEKQDKLMAVCGNNYTTYLHWLPQTMFFGGGFVNFRKLRSYKKKEINKGFDKPIMQISPSFVKDIMGRLSSYYARQGQPDLDNGEFISINALAE